jgi:hypothetical protein
MRSAKDETRIMMICKYHDLQPEMQEEIINNCDSEDTKIICKVLVGQIPLLNVSEHMQKEINDIYEKHSLQIFNTRNVEIKNRRNNTESSFAKTMLKRYQKGLISHSMLMLYGISGTLPDRHPLLNRSYTPEEKMNILETRLQNRFGVNWREVLKNNNDSWLKDGF